MRWRFLKGNATRPHGSLTRAGAALLLLIAPVMLAATCENQDYMLPGQLTLESRTVFEPVAIEVSQPYRGLNSIDYRIENTGDSAVSYGVVVSTCFECAFAEDDDCPGSTSCDESAGFCLESGDTIPCGTPAVAVATEEIEAGGARAGRLTEQDLGLADHLHIEFMCHGGSCSGTFDYVLLLRQVECRDDTDCASDEMCDLEAGFCRAEAATDSGCATMGSALGSALGGFALAIGLIVLGARRRRCGH